VIGAGLLLGAAGASACSVISSASARSLPISVTPISRSLHPSTCTLNSSGTRIVATGTFNPPAVIPVNAFGQPEGALQLQLRVVTSQSLHGIHDVGVGGTYEGVSVGQTSWHLVTTVQRVPGLRPSRCLVTYQVFGVAPGARGS
jgi:hypothetical protein